MTLPAGQVDPILLERAQRWLKRQPTPITGTASVTQKAMAIFREPMIAALLWARRDATWRKYGTELMTVNGRCARCDMLQELVDALMYAVQNEAEALYYERPCIVMSGSIAVLITNLCDELDREGL